MRRELLGKAQHHIAFERDTVLPDPVYFLQDGDTVRYQQPHMVRMQNDRPEIEAVIVVAVEARVCSEVDWYRLFGDKAFTEGVCEDALVDSDLAGRERVLDLPDDVSCCQPEHPIVDAEQGAGIGGKAARAVSLPTGHAKRHEVTAEVPQNTLLWRLAP